MADHQPPEEKRKNTRGAADQIELEPWYKDGNDDIVEPDQVTLQTQYFWKNWVRILGVGPAGLLIRLRMYCYDNRKTGERRDWCFPGQKTLAHELGVHRETIMTWLRRLETFDFIRRTPRTRWSAEHGRPVRTTNAYRIKMWDPVIPDHEGALFVRDAQRMIEESPNPFENQPHPDKSEKPTYGPRAVDNHPHESKFPTHDAVEKTGSRKKYLEGVLNERNVDQSIATRTDSGPVALSDVLTQTLPAGTPPKTRRLANVLPQIQTSTQNKDRLVRVEDLAGQILELLGDGRSRPFYRMVARRFLDAGREHDVYQLLSEIKAGARDGQLKNPAAVFTARIKELAEMNNITL